MHHHCEYPDASIARDSVVRKIREIKAVFEEGSDNPDYIYHYQGLHLYAEYEVVYHVCGEDDICVLRKARILDGNPTLEDDLRQWFQMEADMMSSMDMRFEEEDLTLFESGCRFPS